jgi:hypothetical protein
VKRSLIVVAVVVVAGAVTAGIVVWRTSGGGGGEASVRTASLSPGQIRLVLANDSAETTRLAQIIVNDAFVDFRSSTSAVKPGETAQITISYPWIAGESYEGELLTSTGTAIDFEIEDAEAA